jgi:hypothetical protein
MPNAFSKEEIVAFDQLLPKFEDQLTMTNLVRDYRTDQTQMARSGDTIWRPEPYIMTSNDGSDATSNFKEVTQLSVPARIDRQKHVAVQMTDRELRDALQAQRFGEAAAQKLASDINRAIVDVVALEGTIFVKRTGAASGFDDGAAIANVLDAQGISNMGRQLVLSPDAYRGCASDLQKNTRSFGDPISNEALRRAFVGELSEIQTYKADYLKRQAAAGGGGGLTISTLAAGVNIYVPSATSTGSAGQTENVDNRRQLVTVSSTTSVAAGDSFTVAGLEAVHHITKQSTGALKSFRVISVESATTMVISPPIISAQDGSQASAMYQNVTNTTPSATAAIVFLNTVAGQINPFFLTDAVELLPGTLEVPNDSGVAVMVTSTKQGIPLRMMKFVDINTGKIKFRWDEFFGVSLLQPEMAGLIMFSQT